MSRLYVDGGKIDEESMEDVPNSELYSNEQQPLLAGDTVQKSGFGAGGPKEGCTSYKRQGANEIATFFNFAKASIGSGSFALPWGILQVGVLVGGLGMILLGLASVYTMQLMLECKHYVCARLPSREKRKSLNYTELGRQALGGFGKWAVDISVLGCNLGVCAGYMIFIAGNLLWAANCFEDKIYNSLHHNTSDNLTSDLLSLSADDDEDRVCFTTWEVYALILPILIGLTFLPSFKILAYSAYIGSVFLVLAVSVVYVFGFINHHVFCAVSQGDILYVPAKGTGIALWFGVTAFLFCVHSMVIPLESVMKYPHRMQYVLDAALVIVLSVNLPFAIYGYLLFGSATKGYVFENLPGGVFYDLVRVFLSVELTLTFPIVFKPASDVAEEIWYNFLMVFVRLGRLKFVEQLYTSSVSFL
ncbi:Proton-coupled amino acid transporter 4 [Geodia barretti]|uniref:Proton-coupled amino acid transporter 4 n=1 Tax=Geodia barretti TaxID=519541 RepID=A0AA35TJG1_GEOBA|nr:Proton-coupled amino acid transporter 4 [Geodia barretti]